MANTKKYWKAIDELNGSPVVQKLKENEFAEELPVEDFLGNQSALESSNTSRRDFLKYLGFSTAAATLAACEAPIIESIPYVVKPADHIPGIPDFYATTYFDGYDFASVLVKVREGRPIKMEPNSDAKFNNATNARIQGSVLSLYDEARLRKPQVNGEEAEWSEVIPALGKAIREAGKGKQVVFLTGTIISPTLKKLVKQYAEQFENFRHVSYDAVSASGKLKFYNHRFNKRALPVVNMSNARYVVGFGADFLSDFEGQQLATQYAEIRKPGKDMARHVQIESNLSLTGSNADKRIKAKPSAQGAALIYVYNKIAGASLKHEQLDDMLKSQLDVLVKELKANAGKSLVLNGFNHTGMESLAFGINEALGNVGKTIHTDKWLWMRAGDDDAVAKLVSDMKAGNVGALVMHNVNPAYTMNSAMGFAEAIEKVGVSASFTDRMDETASLCQYALPVNHFFESWGDAEPVSGHYALIQPVIRSLFDTRQLEEVLMQWNGIDGKYYDYLKQNYTSDKQTLIGAGWNQVLHDGFAEIAKTDGEVISEPTEDAEEPAPRMNMQAAAQSVADLSKDGGLEIMFYAKAGLGNGVQANNPWLHELPDPITRISYDNYVTVSRADAEELELTNKYKSNGILTGHRVNLTVGGLKLEGVPVLIQPGQAKGSVGLAFGYGRTKAGKLADGLGVNAYALVNKGMNTSAGVKIEKAEGWHEFASSQIAHTMMGRKIVNEVSLDEFLNKEPQNATQSGWNEKPVFETHKGPMSAKEANLWKSFDHSTEPMWNMSIDLTSCIGCGACVVACHIENNVPPVGKDEVRKLRDMHWLRIDRYYTSDMDDDAADAQGLSGLGGVMSKFTEMEVPSDSPEVVFQPVMCQHCNHAPCETVCPVAATSHSAEGLNHMAYNRCIGTRYCANNCPYKVRRFNWFNYIGNEKFADVNPAQNELGRMVLNPDVTVRSRGVMEKCSMCIQRIQYGKLEAKKAGRPIKDGDVMTACQQACPTHAIEFGNINDEKSKVTALLTDKRAYHLLEEVGTQPSVFYQTKVRNKA